MNLPSASQAADAAAAPLERTSLLLASNKADSIKVRSRDGDAIGKLYSLMVNKRTGQATYAILNVGGFLGIGKSFHPLPFQLLSYDSVADSYIVTIDRRLLEGGPSWASNPPNFDQAYADRVSSYYGCDPADLTI